VGGCGEEEEEEKEEEEEEVRPCPWACSWLDDVRIRLRNRLGGEPPEGGRWRLPPAPLAPPCLHPEAEDEERVKMAPRGRKRVLKEGKAVAWGAGGELEGEEEETRNAEARPWSSVGVAGEAKRISTSSSSSSAPPRALSTWWFRSAPQPCPVSRRA
jgi:hypothetical protein